VNKIKTTLTRKIGPLPAWAWLAVLGGVLLYMRRKTSAATQSDGTDTTPDTTDNTGSSTYDPAPSDGGGAADGGDPGDGTDPTTGATDPSDDTDPDGPILGQILAALQPQPTQDPTTVGPDPQAPTRTPKPGAGTKSRKGTGGRVPRSPAAIAKTIRSRAAAQRSTASRNRSAVARNQNAAGHKATRAQTRASSAQAKNRTVIRSRSAAQQKAVTTVHAAPAVRAPASRKATPTARKRK
jgi:hypothetical protein